MKQIMEQIQDPMEAAQRFMDGRDIYAMDLKKRSVFGMHLVSMKELGEHRLLFFELKLEPGDKDGSPEEADGSMEETEGTEWQEA